MTDPTLARIAVPARPQHIDTLRSVTAAALMRAACGARCIRDVGLAAEELASVLLSVARPDGTLELEVRADDDDVYVRMAVPARATRFAVRSPELTDLLLEETTDSYDLRVDRGDLVAVIQHAHTADA